MEKKTPGWILEKVRIISRNETLEFVGKMGADGVIDGKLPNGDDYEWKKHHTRKLKKPKR